MKRKLAKWNLDLINFSAVNIKRQNILMDKGKKEWDRGKIWRDSTQKFSELMKNIEAISLETPVNLKQLKRKICTPKYIIVK